MSDQHMIGKTIAKVLDLDYDGQALIFTDGSAAVLHPTGYEADGVSIEACSEMDVHHEEALQENRRRDQAASWKRARERYEAGEMKGTELVMYEMTLDSLKVMREQISRQVFWQE